MVWDPMAGYDERYQRYRRVFSMYGMTIGQAVKLGYFDPSDNRTTTAGRSWIQQKATGQEPFEVDWGGIVYEAGSEVADGARAVARTVGTVAGAGGGAAVAGAAEGLTKGLGLEVFKNPWGMALIAGGAWMWATRKRKR